MSTSEITHDHPHDVLLVARVRPYEGEEGQHKGRAEPLGAISEAP